MQELQQLFTQWISGAADFLPVGYAFGAGMVSVVNPCGFAMLPAYLGLYLGSKEIVVSPASVSTTYGGGQAGVVIPAQVGQAILVTLVVTGGFVLLFGGVGILISASGRLLITVIPWAALGIGVLLLILGIAMLRGRRLSTNFAARIAQRVGNPEEVGVKGFFLFGVAFAAASLSCTLPIFLTVVAGSLTVGGFVAASFQFISYALGMGLVILILTISMAVFKGAMVERIRAALPYVEQVSALLLVVAGSYMIYYWLFKGRLINTFI